MHGARTFSTYGWRKSSGSSRGQETNPGGETGNTKSSFAIRPLCGRAPTCKNMIRQSVGANVRTDAPRLDRSADVDLMHRAGAGDREAQRSIVTRLVRRVQHLSRALLAHRDDAKDAAQLSLIQILQSAGQFRGDCDLEGWADRVVVRTTLRHARQVRRVGSDSLENERLPSVAPVADQAIVAAQCLTSLTEVQRTCVLLRCGFEYSVEEIAELTEVSPNTVKDRLKRARECLRRSMDELTPQSGAANEGRRR